jgi:hypothetical protein
MVGVISKSNQIDNIQNISKPTGLMPMLFFRVLVNGNASSGRQFGPFGNFGIIKFNHAQFVIIRFIPIRLEVHNVKNVTAFLFGIGQDLPNGSFDFKEEWILIAFVF